MSGKSIKKHMTPSSSSSVSETFKKNLKRDWNRDNKSDLNPIHVLRNATRSGPDPAPAPPSEVNYPSAYPTGFPTSWGQMGGYVPPMQNVDGWQLNPAQIDAMMAYGNGTSSMQGLPAAGSFLARLAALRQGGRDGT